MIRPALDELITKVDSRYTLVVVAAKRARQIMDGDPKLVEARSTKPVMVALEEVAADKVTYERRKSGSK